MSFTYGFYNSKNGDRKYNARQMALIFDALITNGVMAHIGDCFHVKPSSGMSVSVGTGFAWFDHTWSYNDTEMIVTAEQSNVVLDRIDALVLEVNETETVRENSIKWVVGSASTEPTKPTLTNDEFVHQHPLKYITIPANSTEITAENIENVVGTSECPFATGILEGMSIDSLVAQWEGEFDAWFENIKVILDGDVATNLANQIEALNDKFMPKVVNVTTTGTDLNDYVEDGFYVFSSSATPVNIPVGVNGWLMVIGDGYKTRVKQLWWRMGTLDSNDHGFYIRMRGDNGGWSSWAQVMTTKGGDFTANVKAYETARTTRGLFNEETRASSTTGTLQSVKYFINVIDATE